MTLCKITISTLLLFFTYNSFGQLVCEDTLSFNLIKQFDHYSQKKLNKLKKKNDLDPMTAFNIATYFRLKADTTYKQWYVLTLDLYKKGNGFRYKHKTLKAYILFQTGQAYYFINDFRQAELWFTKAIKASYNDPCLSYYYTLTQNKLGKKDE